MLIDDYFFEFVSFIEKNYKIIPQKALKYIDDEYNKNHDFIEKMSSNEKEKCTSWKKIRNIFM